MWRQLEVTSTASAALDRQPITLADAVNRVLHLPTVAEKTFLVTIGDRTVTGMVARDQMVGPWQIPVANCAVTTASRCESAAAKRMSSGDDATSVPPTNVPADVSTRSTPGRCLFSHSWH